MALSLSPPPLSPRQSKIAACEGGSRKLDDLYTHFLDDLYYSNKHWAQIGGLNLQELNTLELKLLFQLSFAVGVTREEYQEYLDALGGSAPSPAKPSSTQSFKNVADASHSFRS